MAPPETLYTHSKPYARDYRWQSWWCILSTTFLLLAAVAGTLPGLPMVSAITTSII